MRLAVDRLTLSEPSGQRRLRDGVSCSLASSLLAHVCEPTPGQPNWVPLRRVTEKLAELRSAFRRLPFETEGWTLSDRGTAESLRAPLSPEHKRDIEKLRLANVKSRSSVATLAGSVWVLANMTESLKKELVMLAGLELEELVRQALGISEDADPSDADSAPEGIE